MSPKPAPRRLHSRASERALDNALGNRALIRRLADRLTDPVLLELVARNEEKPGIDGWPTGGEKAGSVPPGVGPSPTAQAAEQAAGPPWPKGHHLAGQDSWGKAAKPEELPDYDPVGHRVAEVLGLMSLVARCSQRAVLLLADLERMKDPDTPKAGAGACMACGKRCSGDGSDRLRGGVCNACVAQRSRDCAADPALTWPDWLARAQQRADSPRSA